KSYIKPSVTSSIKLFSLFLPLIIGFFTYHYVNSGPFLPLSCQFFGLWCPSAKDSLRGFVDPRFEDVKEIFIRNIESGDEVGASVTVYYDNEMVVDLQGGITNFWSGKAYDENTLQLVFSSTKVLTSIVIARLVEQDILDYNEKIATYWPEFAQGNKENVTLSDLMQHCAGVSWLDTEIKIKDLYDLDHFAKILERQPHNFNGKRVRAYHGITRGYYLNEIVRRVDPKHRTVGKIVADEILPAYDIEFHYSITPELHPRVASIYTYPMLRILAKLLLPKWITNEPLPPIFNQMFDSNSVTHKTLVHTSPDKSQPQDWNRIEMLIPEGPSYNGVTNSRSMAKLAAMMANGGKPVISNLTVLTWSLLAGVVQAGTAEVWVCCPPL
ncbi:2406_t:CDS:2, partial [Acaulospora colombiana]